MRAAGWLVQTREELDLTAGRGVAVCEFPLQTGFADYLLYLDRKAVGAVEAKAEGTLTGVEAQSAKCAAGLPENLPAYRRPFPCLFESNGSVTYFTKALDPAPRGRPVFNFLWPQTVADWLAQGATLREGLHQIPPLGEAGEPEWRLRKAQGRVVSNPGALKETTRTFKGTAKLCRDCLAGCFPCFPQKQGLTTEVLLITAVGVLLYLRA